MSRKNIFKAYFITCSLLSDFQEAGGIHSMNAEEDLLNWSLNFVIGKTDEEKFTSDIGWTFGLKEKHLKKALKEYKEYEQE